LLRRDLEESLRIAARRRTTEGHLVVPELLPRFVQGLLDELPMLRGIDLAAEKATCREDDHRRELAAELRGRLIVQRLRGGLALLTDAVGLGSRLSAKG